MVENFEHFLQINSICKIFPVKFFFIDATYVSIFILPKGDKAEKFYTASDLHYTLLYNLEIY